MLHKLTSSYREIAKYFPELADKLSSSVRKKQILLDMAGKKEEKPKKITELGAALSNYTRKKHRSFDRKFTTEIKKLAPKWFIFRSGSAIRNKKELLLMAKNKKDKPPRRTRLYYALLKYTQSKSNSYDKDFDKKIRLLRPDWFMSRAQKRKQILLKMAKDNKPKPSSAKTNLGKRLECYLNPNNKHHDPIFTKQIKKLAPQWLVTKFDVAAQKKRQLLKMAERKEPKPKQTTEPGRALVNYTCRDSESEDRDFIAKIKRLAPHSFIPQSQSSEQNKIKLIAMAKNGQPKPKTNTPIGARLNDYTRKSDTYDPVFSEEIRRLAPDWFMRSSEKNKLQLLAVAKNGEPKPSQKTKLGQAFANYTWKNSESKDQDFINQIKKIRPDWFVAQAERSDKNKRSLIRLAKNGKPIPSQKTQLGRALRNYTVKSSGSYDSTFAKNVKKIRPDWFVSNSERAELKKRLLLEMASDGDLRPSQKISLGRCLTNYTVKSSTCYDPAFTNKIKKLAPHWFQKRIVK